MINSYHVVDGHEETARSVSVGCSRGCKKELGSAGRGAHWLRKGLEAEMEGKSLLQVVRERK